MNSLVQQQPTPEEDEAFAEMERKIRRHQQLRIKAQAVFPLSNVVKDHLWRNFELGKGTAPAKQAFNEVLDTLADWLVDNMKHADTTCRAKIISAIYGPGVRLSYLGVRYRTTEGAFEEILTPKHELDYAFAKLNIAMAALNLIADWTSETEVSSEAKRARSALSAISGLTKAEATLNPKVS